jgi:hypothetical protein
MSENEKSVIEVAGKKFDVVKKGREQAVQVIDIAKWLKTYGIDSLDELANEEGEVQIDSGVDFISQVIESLSADALIDLYTILLGTSKKFADENFDIAVLVEAGIMVYENQPSFRRLIERFFSTSTSEETTEESSTTSE